MPKMPAKNPDSTPTANQQERQFDKLGGTKPGDCHPWFPCRFPARSASRARS